jgi:hypothetical protein
MNAIDNNYNYTTIQPMDKYPQPPDYPTIRKLWFARPECILPGGELNELIRNDNLNSSAQTDFYWEDLAAAFPAMSCGAKTR